MNKKNIILSLLLSFVINNQSYTKEINKFNKDNKLNNINYELVSNKNLFKDNGLLKEKNNFLKSNNSKNSFENSFYQKINNKELFNNNNFLAKEIKRTVLSGSNNNVLSLSFFLKAVVDNNYSLKSLEEIITVKKKIKEETKESYFNFNIKLNSTITSDYHLLRPGLSITYYNPGLSIKKRKINYSELELKIMKEHYDRKKIYLLNSIIKNYYDIAFNKERIQNYEKAISFLKKLKLNNSIRVFTLIKNYEEKINSLKNNNKELITHIINDSFGKPVYVPFNNSSLIINHYYINKPVANYVAISNRFNEEKLRLKEKDLIIESAKDPYRVKYWFNIDWSKVLGEGSAYDNSEIISSFGLSIKINNKNYKTRLTRLKAEKKAYEFYVLETVNKVILSIGNAIDNYNNSLSQSKIYQNFIDYDTIKKNNITSSFLSDLEKIINYNDKVIEKEKESFDNLIRIYNELLLVYPTPLDFIPEKNELITNIIKKNNEN